jgi:hypothetical protein
MKYIFLIKILSLLLVNAQTLSAQKKQHGYMCLRGGPSIENGQAKGIGSISVGVSNNNVLGIGAGIGFINYDKPYIPLTVDLSFFGKTNKVTPVVIGQAGYGVYNYTTSGFVGRGGFTGSINGGAGFPLKQKNKVIVTVGYYTYNFVTTATGTSKKTYSKDNRFAITIGLKV